eukprot:gb/GECH01010772.1/.p1 GENE.gb/GECH01010772.1/~~gb/GECH01010772.1/.p1  ORF type:complete len:684 (+),score=105.53 gb/GECH01010772.1/:1-2052(+)
MDGALKRWIELYSLTYQDPLSSLKKLRVGIDAMQWLRSLNFGKKAPLQPGMGGVPFTLEETLDQELEKFRKAEIEPVFVFDGIRYNTKVSSSLARVAEKREEEWKNYETIKNRKLELKSDVTNAPEFVTRVFGYLINKDIQAICAPYQSWSQLVYLAQEGLVQAIYTSYMALTVPLKHHVKLLVDIDFKNHEITWISQQNVLSFFKCDHDNFLEGIVICNGQRRFSLTDILLHFSSHRLQSVYGESWPEHQSRVRDEIQSLKKQVILNKYCQVALLSRTRIYRDSMMKTYGFRFPNDIYYLLLQGVVSKYMLNILASGNLVESSPLAPTGEYASLAQKLLRSRIDALQIASETFHAEFKRDITVKTWWNQNPTSYSFRDFDTSMPWFIAPDDMKTTLSRARKLDRNRDALNIDLGTIVTYKPSLSFKPNHIIRNQDELYASILLQVLFYFGYYEQYSRKSQRRPSVRPTQWFHALKQPQDPEFAEQRFLVLELIHHNLFSLTPWTLFHKNEPIEESEIEPLILSRIFSLIPAKTKSREWEEHVDFDTMAFNTMIRKVQQTSRSLVEAMLVSRIRSNVLRVPWHVLPAFSYALPFHRTSSTALGIILKTALTRPQEIDSVDALARLFPSCEDIRHDMRRGYRFWKQILSMVKSLNHKDRNYDSLYNTMTQADSLLEKNKQRLGI